MILHTLTLTTENCEDIKIDGKYIGIFRLNDIFSSVGRTAINSFGKYDYANTFYLEIHRLANKPYKPFNSDDEINLFDRIINGRDITAVSVLMSDETTHKMLDYWCYVNWIGDNDYQNEAQDAMIGNNGNLYIKVAAKHTLNHFFNLSLTESIEKTDKRWELYGYAVR